MMRLILLAALAIGMGSVALANELDNEAGVTNKELKGTLVLRIDTRSGDASYTQTEALMNSKAEAKALVQEARFAKVPASRMKSELDGDGGASSWYFYNQYPGYGYGGGYGGYNPYCNWYGNSYNPYYQYNYGYYNYYYYGGWGSYYR